MAVRSRRLSDQVLATVAGAVLYTVPSGRTLVLRSVVFENEGALASSCTVAVGGGGAARHTVASGNAPAGGVYFPDLHDDIILNPGDVLYVSSATGICSAMGFGSLLLGEPA